MLERPEVVKRTPAAAKMRLDSRWVAVEPRRQVLVTCVAWAVAGVLLERWLGPAPVLWIGGVAIGGMLMRRKVAGHLGIGILIAAAFGLWHGSYRRFEAANALSRVATGTWQAAVLRGVVDGPVDYRPDLLAELRAPEGGEHWQSVVDVRVSAWRIDGRWRDVSGGGRMVVSGRLQGLLPGDAITIYGGVQTIPGPTNPGGLDMREVYSRRRQSVRIRVASPDHVQLVEAGSWWWPWQAARRALAWTGDRGREVLEARVGAQAGQLASAIVLGRREAVDVPTRERLLETGTVHLLSVSGLHLGMLAVAAIWTVSLLGLRAGTAAVVVIAVCAGYAGLTGGRPPVLRAGVLVALALLARRTGRRADGLNVLAAAALLLMCLNPTVLSSVGPQLSLLAVGTLFVAMRFRGEAPVPIDPLDELRHAGQPWIVRVARRLPSKLGFAVRASFWVWAITLPIVWHEFHVLSPISVLANVLLSIPLMVSLLAGMATALAGMVWSPLGLVPGIVCRGSLEVVMALVNALAAVPFGHVWMPAPPTWWVIAFYGFLLVAALVPRLRQRRWVLAGFGLWSLVALPLAHVDWQRREGLDLTWIDVGHGTSALVVLPDGERWLYDAGRLGDPVYSSRPIADVLWSRGIRRLDGVIISHADADHYNAVPGLLRRFRIERIVTTEGVVAGEDPGLDRLRAAIRTAGVPVRTVQAGEELTRGGGAVMHVLHPPAAGARGSDNAKSVVLAIRYAGQTVLLPGDLESPGTETVLQHPPLAGGGVMMGPHHGSLQEDPLPLLRWADPSWVVVSGGARSARPEVKAMLGQTGASVHSTAEWGAIRVRIAPGGAVELRTWQHSPW